MTSGGAPIHGVLFKPSPTSPSSHHPQPLPRTGPVQKLPPAWRPPIAIMSPIAGPSNRGIPGLAAAVQPWAPAATALHSIVAILHQPSIGQQPQQAHAGRTSAALDRNLLSQRAQWVPVGDISALNFPMSKGNALPSTWRR